nr:hypothetical protein [Tanacetum cinerariifolium]
MLPIELKNGEIRNTKAYKEYYAFTTGEAVPKPKASSRRKRSDSDTSITPPTATLTPKPTVAITPRLTAAAKGKQTTKSLSAPSEPDGSGTDEGTGLKLGVPDVPTDESEEELSWNSSDDEGADDQGKDGDDDEGDEGDEKVARTEAQQLKIILRKSRQQTHISQPDGSEHVEEEEEDELYRDVNINQGRGLQATLAVEDTHVKSQVKEQVSRILPRIEQSVNAQLEAEVLTISSHSSRTSYAVAADLSEMELKKILIEKIEGNKSIQHSDEQKNLYKALVDAYEADKIILKSYGETVGSDRGSKRQREDEPVQTTSQIEEPLHPLKKPPTPDRDWNKTLPVFQGSTQTWISELEKQADSHSSFNELLDTPLDFFNFIMNKLRVDTLTPELLAVPTFELMNGSCTSLIELEYHLEEVYKATTDQLDWVNPEGQHCKYTTSVTKTKAADYGQIKWIEDLVPRTMWIHEPIDYDKHALWGVSHWGRKRQQFYGFAVNRESALDVYSKQRIIAVMDLKIVEWHSYKHLDWITVRRDDDKLYKFKEGNFKRLRLQDIEDMLLLLVQGKLTNLTVEERFAFNVSLRMFTRSIVIQRRVEDLQLGVESYQKRLNLTKPDTYSDGTLNNVCTAFDDRMKGIRMQYLPQTIWRKGDTDRAAAMIQAIDRMLKTRRIMRSLEKFVGGRLYEGDFRMLQRTI